MPILFQGIAPTLFWATTTRITVTVKTTGQQGNQKVNLPNIRALWIGLWLFTGLLRKGLEMFVINLIWNCNNPSNAITIFFFSFCFQKFRKYEPNDVSFDIVSNLEPQNILPDGLDADTRKIVQQLQDKVNVQNTLIHQTSKALQLCDSMPEFTVSPERIEYERLLLLAILTKNVILREIDLLIDQKARNNNRVSVEKRSYTLTMYIPVSFSTGIIFLFPNCRRLIPIPNEVKWL